MDKNPDEGLKAWKARVDKTLKSDNALDKLVSRTADDIVINPLYQQQDGPRADRGSHSKWAVLQRLDHARAETANRQALTDLQGGATGLIISGHGAPSCYGYGLKQVNDVAAALDGVMLHAIALRLEGGSALAKAFASYIAHQPIDPARLTVNFGLSDVSLVADLKGQGFTGPFVVADGRACHAAGATEAQELACVIADLTAALRAGAAPTDVSAAMAATQDMFVTLAKFRSLRLLWSRVLEASKLPQTTLQVHADTSIRMMAAKDPHSNILRSTAAVFGAGLGGADSICVLPFSIAQGLPNAFARRVARNTQLVLLEESNLWRVADAASGAGYIEHLTDQLCAKAWGIFRDMEATGQRPVFDPATSTAKPIIGVEAYPLQEEFEAAVEAYS